MKQKLKIKNTIYEVSDELFNKIKDMKLNKQSEVRINSQTFKLSEIEIINLNLIDELTDWSALETQQKNPAKTEDTPQDLKTEIKKMLKKRNTEWKPVFKDEVHRVAVEDVWEHLKSAIHVLKYPVIDDTWKDDKTIIMHEEGRISHSVEYKTKIVDLGDKYDYHFWAEANFIFCPECKKHIRKQIVVFNDYESECIIKNV